MGFIRENILKIVTFIIILVIAIVIFSFVFGGKKTTNTTIKTYSQMEQSFVSAAKRYASDNRKLLPSSEKETSKIKLDTLVNEKYIKRLTSLNDENVECTGYVKITYRNSGYSFVPYLKCGNDYETKTIATYIKDNSKIVTSGDGLYELGQSLVYRGEYPNNYIMVGNRLYRIMEINGDELKLVSNKKINRLFVWDDRYNVDKQSFIGINDFSKSRVNGYLNAIYQYSNPSEEDSVFSQQELEKIIPYDICIGKRDKNYNAIDSYNECQTIEKDRMVGLINISDYMRASIDQNCKTIFDKSCINYNYFTKIGSSFRTLTAVSNNTYQVYYVSNGIAGYTNASNTFSPNIVVHINENSIYLSGNGSEDDPYIIR